MSWVISDWNWGAWRRSCQLTSMTRSQVYTALTQPPQRVTACQGSRCVGQVEAPVVCFNCSFVCCCKHIVSFSLRFLAKITSWKLLTHVVDQIDSLIIMFAQELKTCAWKLRRWHTHGHRMLYTFCCFSMTQPVRRRIIKNDRKANILPRTQNSISNPVLKALKSSVVE